MECKHEGKRSKYDGVSLTREAFLEAYSLGDRNFIGVDLSGANLNNTNLCGAQLLDEKGSHTANHE